MHFLVYILFPFRCLLFVIIIVVLLLITIVHILSYDGCSVLSACHCLNLFMHCFHWYGE